MAPRFPAPSPWQVIFVPGGRIALPWEGMNVRTYIEQRTLDAAHYLTDTGGTVRQCAAFLGVSKTTIHKDMRCRLRDIDPGLFAEVSAVLEKNRRERHLRGGMATRRKYEQKRAGEISS